MPTANAPDLKIQLNAAVNSVDALTRRSSSLAEPVPRSTAMDLTSFAANRPTPATQHQMEALEDAERLGCARMAAVR
jgi:hypothetical protein